MSKSKWSTMRRKELIEWVERLEYLNETLIEDNTLVLEQLINEHSKMEDEQ